MTETVLDLLYLVYGVATGRAGWLTAGVWVAGLITLVMLCVAFVRPRPAVVASSYGLFALVWTSGFGSLAWYRGWLFATPPARNFDRAYEATLDRFHLLHLAVGVCGVALSVAAIALAAKTRRFALAAALVPFAFVGVAMVCGLHARGQLDLPRWSVAHVEAMRPLHVAFVFSAAAAVLVAAWPSRVVVPPWLAAPLLVFGLTSFVATRPHAYDAVRPLERARWVALASEAQPPAEACAPLRFGRSLSFRGGLRLADEPMSRDEVRAELVVPREGWSRSGRSSLRLLLRDLPSPDEAAWLDTFREKVPEVVLLRDRTRRIWTATHGWIERHDTCETPWPLGASPLSSVDDRTMPKRRPALRPRRAQSTTPPEPRNARP